MNSNTSWAWNLNYFNPRTREGCDYNMCLNTITAL